MAAPETRPPVTLSVLDAFGRRIQIRPDAVYPVIHRHRRRDGVVYSKIRLLPHLRPLIVAERPERLAREVGKALRIAWAET